MAYSDKWQPLVKRGNAVKTLEFPPNKIKTAMESGSYERGPYGSGDTAVELLDAVVIKEGIIFNKFRLKGPFVWTQETLNGELGQGTMITLSKKLKPSALRAGQEERTKRPPSLLPEETGTYEDAFREMMDMFGRADVYDYPKPVGLPKYLARALTYFEPDGEVLDFFAGSGTTGHAVINLNREDGGRRKLMLVEMAGYFDTVLLPRIQKVMYAPEWEDGKPKRLPTKEEVERTPRVVKVLRLEGYEDALHNLATEETLKREGPRAVAHKERLGEDAYRLQYLVRLPLEASTSMLNLAALEHPFRYTIEVLTEDGPRVETVDLVETFNFLYGLHVERLETWVNQKDGRTYRAVKGKDRDERRVLVLWRDMEGLDPAVERQFLEPKLQAEGPFDEVLINGDAAVPGIRSLDRLFKRLVEEGEV